MSKWIEGVLRSRSKLLAIVLLAIGAATTVLTCYGLFVEAEAKSLLADMSGLKVGESTSADVEKLVKKHSRHLDSRQSWQGYDITTFKVQNRWLSALKLEPAAWFGASVSVTNGRVVHISAWLMRSMNIFPTFQASAGMVDEYDEYPSYYSSRYSDFDFPTPIGKPYLRVLLDSHASSAQRRDAFDFSFRCLVKPGGGCDLPCDYLPSAWQDWRTRLQIAGYSDLFNQHYPKASRCRP